MQRNDLAGSDANFFGKSFYDFQVGFGDPSSQYWIGLENLYSLTHSYTCTLRFDLQNRNDGVWHWAEYSTFSVGHVSTKYVLTIGGVTADFPGDCMADHNGMPFTTYDNDNDNSPTDNCANKNLFKGGFWHNKLLFPGWNQRVVQRLLLFLLFTKRHRSATQVLFSEGHIEFKIKTSH